MTDTRDDRTPEPEGKPLPPREMMSLIGTDPADPVYSTLLPPDPDADAPLTAEAKGLNTLPVQPPTAEEGNAEETTTTVQQTDTASADS